MGRNTSISARSPGASPSHTVYPTSAMSIPYKSAVLSSRTTSSAYKISPASSTSSSSSSSSRSHSPSTPPPSGSSKSFASTAYPDWPKSASFCGNQASSHISDEDLLDLEHLELCDDVRVPSEKTAGISWEATRQPPVVLQSVPSLQRKGRPTPKRTRRSSPLIKGKTSHGMSPIVEAPE